MSTSTEDPRLKVIVEGALTSEHPLVKQGMDEEQILRQRTQAEIQELLSKTVRALNQAENIKAIKTKTLKQIDLDLALAGILNTSLVPYKTSVHPGVGQGIYPLKSNKLVPILTGVKEFLNTSFTKLFEYQEIPRGYRFVTNPTDVTRLGPNKYRIYGDSKNTVLKTALLETYLAATGKTVSNLDLDCSTQTGKWIDGTAIAHVAPLPDNLNLPTLDERFENFTFRYRDETTPDGLLYTHSGYAFGGDRAHIRKGKVFPPQDCSSWLECISARGTLPFTCTTLDQLYFLRKKLGTLDNVSQEWLKAETATHMEETFDVVPYWKNPQQYIEPGQIYAHRNFNLENDAQMQKNGAGGHTTLVLGFISDQQNSRIVALGYDRDMPNVEGFGVQEFPLFPPPGTTPNKTLMLFSVKGLQASKAESQNSSTDLPSIKPRNRSEKKVI